MKWFDLNLEIHNAGKSSEAFDLLCKFLNDKKEVNAVESIRQELEAWWNKKLTE